MAALDTRDFEIRGATTHDVDGLFELAGHLNSVNLPHDRGAIESLLHESERSFAGDISDPADRQYVFALHDLRSQRVIGTSMVISQLGRRGAPYVYLDVHKEEKYSSTLDEHHTHQVLRIGYSYDGPTELGGLVMHPDYRRTQLRLGRAISYVRFLWIAMHRTWFRDELLAEIMPPLRRDGTSRLWEAVGHRFVDMTYQEADKLSKTNKEFIWGLFPFGDIYTALLDQEAQSVIGLVAPARKGVEKMLTRAGFRYANRVDPFDGGPHFLANTAEVTSTLQVRPRDLEELNGDFQQEALLVTRTGAPHGFRVVLTPAEAAGEDSLRVPEGTCARFDLEADAQPWSILLR